jgi:hypothetical protein
MAASWKTNDGSRHRPAYISFDSKTLDKCTLAPTFRSAANPSHYGAQPHHHNAQLIALPNAQNPQCRQLEGSR